MGLYRTRFFLRTNVPVYACTKRYKIETTKRISVRASDGNRTGSAKTLITKWNWKSLSFIWENLEKVVHIFRLRREVLSFRTAWLVWTWTETHLRSFQHWSDTTQKLFPNGLFVDSVTVNCINTYASYQKFKKFWLVRNFYNYLSMIFF